MKSHQSSSIKAECHQSREEKGQTLTVFCFLFISCFTQGCKDDPSITTEMFSYKKKILTKCVQPAGRVHEEEEDDEVQREADSQK